jgi:hypothetical protein
MSWRHYYNPDLNKTLNSLKKKLTKITTSERILEDDSIRPQRGGVILYCEYEDVVYFGFARDAITHDLTDFGGGIRYKKDGDPIEGALREFNEESLNIFTPLSSDSIKESTVIYNTNNLIVFVRISNLSPMQVNEAFKEKYSKIISMRGNKISPKETNLVNENSNETKSSNEGRTNSSNRYVEPEVCGIVWLNLEEYNSVLSNTSEKHKLYSRVRNVINNVPDLLSYL